MKAELSDCAARLPGRRDPKSQGDSSAPRLTSSSLPGFPLAAGPSLGFLPTWSSVLRARATQTRGRATRRQDPQHAAGAPIPAWPRPPGTGLTAPVTTRMRGAEARGTAPLRSSGGAPPAPEHPEDPEDRRSPGAEGLCSRISIPGPSFPAAGTGWARGRSPSRSPEDRGRGAGGAAVRAQPPALGAPLPPGRAAPRRTTGASDGSPRLGCSRASRRRRAGRGWGRTGPRAADSALGLLEARAWRASHGPSRDCGGAPRVEDWRRARRVPGSGPFPPCPRSSAGAGGGDAVSSGAGAVGAGR